MTTTDEDPPTASLTESASWAQLRSTTVGRLAVANDDQPDIVPVNFMVDRGSIVFRTAEGSKLTAAAGRSVAFEADGYDLGTGEAWSVVVKGVAREVAELDEVIDALDLPLFPWHTAPKPRIIRIEPDSITGRRFVARSAGDSTPPRRAAAE